MKRGFFGVLASYVAGERDILALTRSGKRNSELASKWFEKVYCSSSKTANEGLGNFKVMMGM